jgi:hypothetical protein
MAAFSRKRKSSIPLNLVRTAAPKKRVSIPHCRSSVILA